MAASDPKLCKTPSGETGCLFFFRFLDLKGAIKNVWVVSLYTHFTGLYFLFFLKKGVTGWGVQILPCFLYSIAALYTTSIDVVAFSFVSWRAIGIDSKYNINLHMQCWSTCYIYSTSTCYICIYIHWFGSRSSRLFSTSMALFLDMELQFMFTVLFWFRNAPWCFYCPFKCQYTIIKFDSSGVKVSVLIINTIAPKWYRYLYSKFRYQNLNCWDKRLNTTIKQVKLGISNEKTWQCARWDVDRRGETLLR